MRRLLCALVLAAPAVGAQAAKACKVSPKDAWMKKQASFFDDTKHDWSNDTLRTALLEAAGLSPSMASPAQHGVHVDGTDDITTPAASAMRDKLKALASQRGSVWPTRSVVGGAGTHAVYMIVRSDTGLARAALHRMMEAGPAESPAVDVATLEDQLRLVWGRKQIYGTQFRIGANGRIELAPMEDSTHADLRREDAGLPPFKVGLCLAAESVRK